MNKFARIAASFLAMGSLLSPVAASAEGVSSTSEAVAQFDAAAQSSLRPSTNEERMLCAGYWWGLKELHGVSQDVPFWSNMPKRLGPETADLGRQFWAAVVTEAYKGEKNRLEEAGNKVFEYRQQMITRVVNAEETGSIEGVFDILGACVPE